MGGLTTKTAGYDDAKNRKRRMSDATFRMRRNNTCQSTKSFNDVHSDIDGWFDASWMNIFMRISIGRTVSDDIYLLIIRHGLGKRAFSNAHLLHASESQRKYESTHY